MMWMGKKSPLTNNVNFSGSVTINGEKFAVFENFEHRDLSLYAPGGYFWCPDRGEDVVVLQNGEIIATACANVGLKPGEVLIRSAGGAQIRLSNDGNIYIRGNVIKEGERENGDEAV